MRSLSQILVAFKDRSQSAGLTCDECFRYMEYITEEAIAGAEQDSLLKAVRAHLSICPHCREHHLKKLDAMEMYIQQEQISIKMVASD
jgi:Zn finger protein HypA/HybF involved in hydrogenase expression